MPSEKLRLLIAQEAARLLHLGQEPSLPRARMRAARRLVRGWVPDAGMPSDQEIHRQLDQLAGRRAAPARAPFCGPADFGPGPAAGGAGQPAGGSLGGPVGERSSDAEDPASGWERFAVFERLLWPLEHVQQSRQHHPEGDALYHSLQVFTLVQQQRPYDEELLLAALLHDVGKAVDVHNHLVAGLELLTPWITPRTAWLIENLAAARMLSEGTLGARALRRLAESDDFEELKLLYACDRRGRQQGAEVPEVPEALAYLRELAEDCDG